MNKRQWSAVSGLAVGALVAAALASPMQAQAAPRRPAPIGSDPAATQASRPDNLPNPQADAAAALRADAVKQLVNGEASTKTIKGNRVIEVKSENGKSKYVDYPVNREEDIFTVLVEFGDQINPAHRRHARARSTTRSPRPTATGTATRPTTTRPTGCRTSTAPTSRT